MSSPLKAATEFSGRQFRAITLEQAERLGLSRWAVHRLVVAEQWQRIYPGVYLTHSAAPDWNSRAQATLLWGGPDAFLSHEAAWYLDGMVNRPPGVITLSVPLEKRLVQRPGLRVIRRRPLLLGAGKLVRPVTAETLLDLVELQSEPLEIVGLLTRAFRRNLHLDFVLELLAKRHRFRHRKLLKMLLGVVVDCIESPLEYLFDENVEGPHGLPRSKKQVADQLGGRNVRADRLLEEFLLRYELDGELGHPGGRTDLDVWRDNAAVIKNREITLRYRWANIVGTPCKTAAQIVAALRANGWLGTPLLCNPRCEVLEYTP